MSLIFAHAGDQDRAGSGALEQMVWAGLPGAFRQPRAGNHGRLRKKLEKVMDSLNEHRHAAELGDPKGGIVL